MHSLIVPSSIGGLTGEFPWAALILKLNFFRSSKAALAILNSSFTSSSVITTATGAATALGATALGAVAVTSVV